MMSQIIVPLDADYECIALAAGAEPGIARYWNDGTLKVPGVSEDALFAALNLYDHMATLRARKLAEIRVERDRLLAETDWMALRSREKGESGVVFASSPAGLHRQRLRDLPNNLEAGSIAAWNEIATPEELATYEPGCPTSPSPVKET